MASNEAFMADNIFEVKKRSTIARSLDMYTGFK